MMNLGIRCLNMSLSNRKKSERITTNRSMIRRTFDQKGVDYASELALQNCKDLYSILQWNEETISSSFVCLQSSFLGHPSMISKALKDYEKIMYWCKKAGDYARENGHKPQPATPDHLTNLQVQRTRNTKYYYRLRDTW